MSNLKTIIILICILFTLTCSAQSVLVEFPLPGKIENIQSYVSRDNIYLVYENITQKTYQIKPNGTFNELKFKLPDKALCIGVQDKGDTTWFYYLLPKQKDVVLKALAYNAKTQESVWNNEVLFAHGQIIGVSNDEILSLVIYDKALNKLRIIQVDGLHPISANSFELPVDLSNDYRYLSCIQDDPWTSIRQSSEKFKLYKRENKWIISIDYTSPESKRTSPQTMVMTFDMESGSQTTKRFETNETHIFRSFIHHDRLYRSFTSNKIFQLEVLDMITGEIVQQKKMIRDTTFKKSFVYFRNGKTLQVSKKESMFNMMSTSSGCNPSVIAFSEKDSCEAMVIWGTYYSDEDGVVLPGLLPSLIATAIRQMIEPTGLSRYLYLQQGTSDRSACAVTIKSSRELIDDYEVSLNQKGLVFKNKAYVTFQARPVGLYYNERTLNLTLIQFNK